MHSNTAAVRANGQSIKDKLVALVEPKNEILSRLQNQFCVDSDNKVVLGYSRMHNRHNRS